MTMLPISRRIALATGLSYHVLEWNPASASDHTIVLVHGFLDNAWGWKATVDAGLGQGLHIIAPDMRGHGDSDRVGPGGYYHFMDYLADLADVVRQLGRSKVSLVGHSMGGSIVGYLAGTTPARFSRVALLEGLGPPEQPTPVPDRVARWIEGWNKTANKSPTVYPSLEDAAARLCALDPRLDPALARELAIHGTTENTDGSRSFKHDPLHLTMGPYPFRVDVAIEFWRRITAPVLLVEGAVSPNRFVGAEAQRRTEPFANREFAVLSDAAHMMQRHQPAALASLVHRFLTS